MNPCSICELYAKGVKCENEEQCPVGIMKKENKLLKSRNTRLQKKVNEASWGYSDRLGDRHEMGSW